MLRAPLTAWVGWIESVMTSSLSREPVFAGRALSALQITAVTANPRSEPAPGPAQPALPPRYLDFTLNIPLGEAPAGALPKAAS